MTSAGSGGLRVAVLGAAGTVARAIVRDLAESAEVGSLLLLDLDARRADQVAEEHGAGKATAAEADARDPGPGGLAETLDGCDVLVNSASYRVNLDAMEAALRCGCHYLDLGGLYWMTARQLDLDERFAAAGRLALLGIGGSPGKTNVMAARAARELAGEPVREIVVSAAGRDPAASSSNGSSPLRVPYSLQTLLDELTMRPVVIDDGRPHEIEPLTPAGEVEFPAPIGRASTIHTLHSEMRTFQSSFGCERASFRLSLTPGLLERLRTLVGADAGRIAEEAAATQPPSDRALAAHVVEARSDTRRARVAALTRPMSRWGLGGGVVSTAAPAAAAVRLIARGRIAATGVRPPESCIEPGDLFGELEGRGCTFTVEREECP